ncbi:hypothetical protein NIES2104_44220 [Leptolyngbya sp. NIES-2104]|nr:hypothetical protein NIES2104_44220 [Leptolyngbya sp. NIES-2104]
MLPNEALRQTACLVVREQSRLYYLNPVLLAQESPQLEMTIAQ